MADPVCGKRGGGSMQVVVKYYLLKRDVVVCMHSLWNMGVATPRTPPWIVRLIFVLIINTNE